MEDVEPALVANGEPAEAVHPSESALDDPAVATEPLAAVDAAPGDAGRHAALTAGAPASAMIIGLVGMELVRPTARAPWPARDRRDGIEQWLEGDRVMDVGACQQEGERNALPVSDQMALGAGPSAVGWVRPGRVTPLLAATAVLSMQARLQSMRAASRQRLSSSRCRRSHTPACCQSRSRRQQVTPEPHPIDCGSISHGMPVRSTNRIPLNAALATTGGLPPFGFGRSAGTKGSTIDQSSSETNCEGIRPHESGRPAVQGF